MNTIAKQQVDELKREFQQVVTSLRILQVQDHSILQARKRAEAIERIEDLRSTLHLLQIEIEQGETPAEAMSKSIFA